MSRIVDTIRSGSGQPETERGSGAVERTGDPAVGVVSYFHFEDRATVEQVVAGLEELGVRHLRTSISWHDFESPGGRDWYEWLLPELTDRFEVMPCVLYTPTHLGIVPKTSSPPRDPYDYARFIDTVLSDFGEAFEHVELWNEPNNFIEWDWTLDPEWVLFAEMIAAGAAAVRHHGSSAVLGGMSPLDPNWLHLMFKRGAMADIDVLGIHGFPGTWEAVWEGWTRQVDRSQEVLDHHGSPAEIWITECGYSTWHHDEYTMLRQLVEVARAPVPRVYWYSAQDLAPERATLDGFHADERAYHFGLYDAAGRPKLPARVWGQRGFTGLNEFAAFSDLRLVVENEHRPVLITGGAGFVGTNLADSVAAEGRPVVVLDNLSRPGVEENLRWLVDRHPGLIRPELGDVRDRFVLRRALDGVEDVVHLAAQVAVTTSIDDPVNDIGVNLQGTVNLLEEMRRLDDPPAVLFTSTNKVYGDLEDVELRELAKRYEPKDTLVAAGGIGESQPLSLHSPYGCSKGAADQYVLDYGRTFGIQSAVFRMSCIYGPHQCGTEDQGWVAHFLIQALDGSPIQIYGDGKQVRDVLYVTDLVSAMRLVLSRRDALMDGRAFNIGGGAGNSVSLLEVLDMIADIHGAAPEVSFSDWRRGDQRYYVSDTSAFEAATGWRPLTPARQGIANLYRWLVDQHAEREPVDAARRA
ncbi:MAG TPA: NAD-dependent epimerase/dehydratase family protein [Actinomycetota bacterium]|nr:NAD-dependent epimerase/dehydratase family protein [Actinomycetota bacterium]